MFLYVSLSLGHYTSISRLGVDSRVLLGLFGILLVLLSTIIAGGILSAFGFKMTLIISEVIPFLVLAVGVDNIFIMVDSYHRAIGNTIPERVTNGLSQVGPGIVFSALTESVVFATATLIDMPAVRAFSAYAALAVGINALLQLTCFIAMLTLDSRRQEVSRVPENILSSPFSPTLPTSIG
jgi:Niemann-Pick C1 protein